MGFRTDWDVRRNDHLTIQGDMYKGGVGETVGYGSFNPPEQIISNQAVSVSGGNLLAQWRHDLREGSDIQVEAYYDRTSAQAPHYQETRNTFDVDLPTIPTWLRWISVVVSLVLAAVVAAFSRYGAEFRRFVELSRIELRKIVWPSRNETRHYDGGGVRVRDHRGTVLLGGRLGAGARDRFLTGQGG